MNTSSNVLGTTKLTQTTFHMVLAIYKWWAKCLVFVVFSKRAKNDYFNGVLDLDIWFSLRKLALNSQHFLAALLTWASGIVEKNQLLVNKGS